MKKTIIAIILVLAVIVSCAAVFAGCNKTPKSVTVGITNAAPMNFKNASGEWVGFDTELTLKVFNELGYEVMFKEIEWANKYVELEAGTIDCIWNGFTANSSDKINGVETDRKDIVNMSLNYMINEQCVVRNTNVPFVDENSFAGKTIAFETGSSGDAGVGYIEEDYEDIEFIKKPMKSQSEALREVNSGTADFAVVDKSIAENALGGYTNLAIVPVEDFDYFGLEYYAIGFKKDEAGAALRDKVNDLLKKYYESGYLKDLAEKYNIEYVRITSAFAAN